MSNAVPIPGQPDKGQAPVEGSAGMSDKELLTSLFALVSTPDQAKAAAENLLNSHGSLRGLAGAAGDESRNGRCHDEPWLELLRLCGEFFTRQLSEGVQRGASLTSPADTVDFLQRRLQWRRREVFQCLFLDTRHRVICHEELFQGSIDGACVYPRVVAEHALRFNAAAVIVAHNHPSGVTEPSLADQAITRRLKDALALLEIRLLDHFVIGDGEPVSMASRGMV